MRRQTYRLLAGLWALIALLVAPPGGAVCWPLAGERHVHIGWSQPDERAALHLTVFAHDKSQPVSRSNSAMLTPAVSVELPTAGDMLAPPVVVVWLAAVAALGWRLTEQATARPQRSPAPPIPPPRAV